ncbi:MAG: hypothetical protein WC483_02815 [Candidatus Paceibacterota bacterium]|mgnify:CR=1 FL=1
MSVAQIRCTPCMARPSRTDYTYPSQVVVCHGLPTYEDEDQADPLGTYPDGITHI